MKVSIRGVSSQMNRFRYLYGIILGELLLKHANNLSWTLQHTSLLPRRSTSKSGVDEAVETLNGIRGDEQVHLFWTKVTSKAGAVDVGEPALPRRIKAPIRFDDNICCVKETSRKQLRQRTNSRPTAAVGRKFRCCDSIWSNGYLSRERVLSVTKPGTAVAFLQFIIVIPATNATSERLFTTLRHLKSYLGCRNVWTIWCCCMFTIKEWTDDLDMQAVLI